MKKAPLVASVVAILSCGRFSCDASPDKTPQCHIAVVDALGKAVTHYDLYIYHCKSAGSRFSRVFFFPDQASSEFVVPDNLIRPADIARVSPHLGVVADYWIVGVNKHGYRSRRWEISPWHSERTKIVLHKASDPGEDYCDGKPGECDACRSHEYSMYGETLRYRTLDCSHGQRH
jgi:hypothetical protein